MIPLAALLKLKYPNIDLLEQVQVWDRKDGNGEFIYKWDSKLGDIPSSAQLAQWREELSGAYVKEQNKIKNQGLKEQLLQLDLKSIRALRTKDQTRLDELEAQAVELRKKLLPE